MEFNWERWDEGVKKILKKMDANADECIKRNKEEVALMREKVNKLGREMVLEVENRNLKKENEKLKGELEYHIRELDRVDGILKYEEEDKDFWEKENEKLKKINKKLKIKSRAVNPKFKCDICGDKEARPDRTYMDKGVKCFMYVCENCNENEDICNNIPEPYCEDFDDPGVCMSYLGWDTMNKVEEEL